MNSSRSGRLLTAAMLGVASGSVLVPLNSTMLAVALPGIMDEFHLGAGAVASLVTLYLGAVAVALPVSGSLGDRFGHRRMFLLGVAIFALASAVAVGATTFGLLQAARVLQAVSGAFVSTSSAALIREFAPPARRGEAFGLFDLLVSTSAAAGPFIGGVLVGLFGWRSLFVVAVPVALIALASVGLRRSEAPESEGAAIAGPGKPATGRLPARSRTPLDLLGLALLATIIGAFLIAIRGGEGAIPIVAAVAIIPLGVVFTRYELRVDHPAIDPRLFSHPPFAAAVAGVFGSTIVLHASFILIPLLVERVLSGSATTSGLVLLGISGVAAFVAPLGGRASDRRGRRALVVAGSVVMAIGLAGLWTPMGGSSFVAIAVLLGVVGLGMGLSGSARQAAAFEVVRPERVGMAAGTYYTGRYLGGVVGASIAGALLASSVTSASVSLGFGVLVLVSLAVAAASLGLPGRRSPEPAAVGPRT
ncbi:MAG: MFS transporter [Candidatus Limnocylindrales bacterium]